MSAAEGHIFHNRLTHTLKVAQLGRRLAEQLISRCPEALRASDSQIDPEVVEAAALAHDLGHPPFGHIGEGELASCVKSAGGLEEGYEGNAQSFRIVTTLAEYRATVRGLDLTRSTRAAILKYPWVFNNQPPHKPKQKFGAYKSEEPDLEEATAGRPPRVASLEAQIMDHADAVAYSVHDLDDFYRAGLIPLQTIGDDLRREIATYRDSLPEKSGARQQLDDNTDALAAWYKLFLYTSPYRGTASERSSLQGRSARLIQQFVEDVSIDVSGVYPMLQPPASALVYMGFLQHLVREYVIENPRLATQQYGQRRVIRLLFDVYFGALTESKKEALRLVPAAFQAEAEDLWGNGVAKESAARVAADIVSSLTDEQAVRLHARFLGTGRGAISDFVD